MMLLVLVDGRAKSVAAQQKRRIGASVMSILNLLLAAGKAVADWRRRQRAYAEMMALNDRALADIGIRRSQIHSLIYGEQAPPRPAEAAPARARPHLAWRKPA
jgi:uncharacterized protein YjiS (DUF1127 family)